MEMMMIIIIMVYVCFLPLVVSLPLYMCAYESSVYRNKFLEAFFFINFFLSL